MAELLDQSLCYATKKEKFLTLYKSRTWITIFAMNTAKIKFNLSAWSNILPVLRHLASENTNLSSEDFFKNQPWESAFVSSGCNPLFITMSLGSLQLQ